MTSNDPNKYRHTAVKDLINNINYDGFRAGVVTFTSSASIVAGLTNDKETLVAAINRLGAGNGGTNIIPALERCVEMHYQNAGRRKIVVLLTDGQSSDNPVNAALAAYANYGIVINTVALGSSANTSSLQKVASVSKGTYFYINDTGNLSLDDVEKQLDVIYQKLTKQLTFEDLVDEDATPKYSSQLSFSDLYTGIESKEVEDWITTASTNLLTGNFIDSTTDLSVPSDSYTSYLNFTRTYNSFNSRNESVVGLGFTTNIDMKVEDISSSSGEDIKYGTVTAGSLNVRYGPGTTYGICGSLSKGTVIEVNDVKTVGGKDWYKISYNGIDAYVAGWYISGNPGYKVTFSTGSKIFFSKDSSGNIIQSNSTDSTLTKTSTGFVLTNPDQSKVVFDKDGKLIAFEDRYGNQTTLTYSGGKLSKLSDPVGRSLQFTYNSAGLLSKIVDPIGRSVSYAYDSQKHLVRVTNANGDTRRYTYNSDTGFMETVTDENQNQYTRNDYDIIGRIVRQYDAKEIVKYYIYDDQLSYSTAGNSARYIIDENGNESKIVFSAELKPITSRDALGNTTSYKYEYYNEDVNAWVDITSVKATSSVYETFETYTRNHKVARRETTIDPNGNASITEYDKQGNVINETNALGYTKTNTYDSKNNLIRTTDECSNTTSYTYDSSQLYLEKEADALGQETAYSYYSKSGSIKVSGLKKSITNCSGAVTSFEYSDANNNCTKITNALGFSQMQSFDSAGRKISSTDANGNVTQMFYDNMDHVIKVTDPLGFSELKTYDAVGNLKTFTDKCGNKTTYSYSKKNEVIKTIYPNGAVETYSYDNTGNMVSKTDVLGGRTTYDYDASNRKISEKNALGNVTLYQYDAVGNCIKTTNALGKTETCAYDKLNRLYQKTNALGNTTTYYYDNVGNMTSEKNALGYSQTITYDKLYRQTAITNQLGNKSTVAYYDSQRYQIATDAKGNKTTIFFDAVGNKTKETDAKGNETNYTFDPNGNMLTEVNAVGGVTTWSYDAMNRKVSEILAADTEYEQQYTSTYNGNGGIVSVTDAAGSVSYIAYDKMGNIIKKTNALGKSVLYTYDQAGNVLSFTDECGNVSSYEYDVLSRKIAETLPEGGTTTYTYDAVGNITRIADPLGSVIRYTYDAANQKLTEEDSLGYKLSYTYDKAGNNVTKTDANGNVTKYTYDKENKLLSTSNALNETTYNTYDANGNLATEKDAKGNSVTYSYDVINNLISEKDQSGYITGYEYDAVGNKTKVIDANKNTTVYSYDLIGRMLSVTDAGGTLTSYTYDALDNVLSVTDGNGNSTVREYDALSRVTKETDAAGKSITYSYDAAGKCVSATDKKGVVSTYVYDKNGNVVSENVGDICYTYSYDANNNLVTSNDLTGTTRYVYDGVGRVVLINTNGKIIRYTYDGNDNIVSVVAPSGEIINKTYDKANRLMTVENGDDIATYSYDKNGNRTAFSLNNGTSTTYSFDARNLLTGLVNKDINGNMETYSYTYNAVAMQTKKVEPQGTTTYDYNTLNQIVKIVEPDNRTTEFTYDSAGNRSTQTVKGGSESVNSSIAYQYNSLNELTSTTETVSGKTIITNYSYDANGNQITVAEKSNGSTKTSTYSYNALNELISVSLADGTRASYSYYSSGLRAAKTVNGKTTSYYYDGKNLINESSSGGYITNIYGTNLISRKGAGIEYYSYNGHADVVAITDSEGTIVSTYQYDAFGNTLKETGNSSNPYKYAGYYEDAETGLYYLRTRYYNPEIARFITADSIDGSYHDPLSLNKYTYCHNSPIINYDEDGQFVLTALIVGAVVGAAIGGTIGGVKAYNESKKSNNGVAKTSDVLKGVGKGMLFGAAAGAIAGTGIGAAAHVAAAGSTILAGTISGAGISAGSNLLSQTVINNDTKKSVLDTIKNVNAKELLVSTAVGGLTGAIGAGVSSGVSTAVGSVAQRVGLSYGAKTILSSTTSGLLSGSISGATTDFVNQSIDIASGKQKTYDFSSVKKSAITGGLFGGVMGFATGSVRAYQMNKSIPGTGTYKDVKGHHVHQKAGFKSDNNYDLKQAFSLSDDYMENNGITHLGKKSVTTTQHQMFKNLYESGANNSMRAHTEVAYRSLRNNGASGNLALKLVDKSLKSLYEMGVSSPTNIPWYK